MNIFEEQWDRVQSMDDAPESERDWYDGYQDALMGNKCDDTRSQFYIAGYSRAYEQEQQMAALSMEINNASQ